LFAVGTEHDEQEQLWVAKADGSDAKRISPGNPAWLAWSPKGDLIAFTSLAAEPNIFVIKPDGTGRRQLSSLTACAAGPA
jgi:TolB protein